jgi:hypothetical protein
MASYHKPEPMNSENYQYYMLLCQPLDIIHYEYILLKDIDVIVSRTQGIKLENARN